MEKIFDFDTSIGHIDIINIGNIKYSEIIKLLPKEKRLLNIYEAYMVNNEILGNIGIDKISKDFVYISADVDKFNYCSIMYKWVTEDNKTNIRSHTHSKLDEYHYRPSSSNAFIINKNEGLEIDYETLDKLILRMNSTARSLFDLSTHYFTDEENLESLRKKELRYKGYERRQR